MTYKFNTAKVLIVDDMLPMQTLLRSILGLFGFEDIEIADNGKDGFEKFCRYKPDLVITDWIMEPVNGMELIEKIRKDPRSPDRFTPVILMTGFSSRLRVETARDKGITEFVVKPFTAKDLYSRIERVIEKPRQFVDTRNFFGPDRRRRKSDNYDGPPRRSSDDQNTDDHLYVSLENKKILSQLHQNIKDINK